MNSAITKQDLEQLAAQLAKALAARAEAMVKQPVNYGGIPFIVNTAVAAALVAVGDEILNVGRPVPTTNNTSQLSRAHLDFCLQYARQNSKTLVNLPPKDRERAYEFIIGLLQGHAEGRCQENSSEYAARVLEMTVCYLDDASYPGEPTPTPTPTPTPRT